MPTVLAILFFTLVGLQYKLWFGEGNITQWKQLEKKLEAHKQENEKMASKNNAMQADILELKRGDQALEEQARYELGMVKQNEVYYHFVD